MNQNKILIIAGTIIILMVTGLAIFLLRRNDAVYEPMAMEAITSFPCPLSFENCVFAEVITDNDKGYEYTKLGFDNSASGSAVLAVFDGDMRFEEVKLQDEKKVVILSQDGQTAAEYKFLGALPVNISSQAKAGEAIGLINNKSPFYNNKYNFIFSVYDLKQEKYIKFDLIEKDGTYSITKL